MDQTPTAGLGQSVGRAMVTGASAVDGTRGNALKVDLLSHSDTSGGAARAAYRIHCALRAAGVDSLMRVNDASGGDWTVQSPIAKWGMMVAEARPRIGALVNRVLQTSRPMPRSPAVLPSLWPNRINAGIADVVHLHWVNCEMMSIEDIGKINKPVVWTLHDMWAFCGAEHVTEDVRWREGYTTQSRPTHESGFDLDRWVWRRKRRAWRIPMHMVTPSHWLGECVRQSTLMRDWPVSVVPNAINTEVWRPIDKTLARHLMGLPPERRVLLFGTFGANSARHKGFDLLQSALQHLRGQANDLQLVVFGQLAPRDPIDVGFPVHYAGHLHDDLSLRVLYSAADAMVVPSRVEAFCQTASEALACGTPVIAFAATGLLDVVKHQQTGYLAKAFDTEDLARGIEWVFANSERYADLCAFARRDAVERFSYSVVAKKYLTIYETAISIRPNGAG